MEQVGPSLIMMTVTLVFTGLLLLPTLIKMRSNLIRFYWRGFWMFLALISIVAGGSSTLMLMGVQVDPLSMAMLSGIMASYILFVVFAWFRLVGMALFVGFQRARKPA